ncbi:MAG: hypothetical protein WKF75_08065 [Singulisphaera sp.]
MDASGLSRYRIAKSWTFRIDDEPIHERTGGLSMEYLDRLAELLGLHIVAEPKGGKDG